MNRTRRLTAVAVAALALVATACGSDDGADGSAPTTTATQPPATGPESGTRTIATAYGDVEVPVAPQRVVAVSYDTPWQLMAVGVTPVAVQDYGQWISEFTAEQQAFVDGIPTIGAFGEPNLEAIAAADPDLIVGDAYEIDESLYDQLSAIAPTAIIGGDDRGDWKAISAGIADAAGAGDAVAAARATYESELARIRSTYADALALPWAHVSLGNNEAEFSVQFPTGIVGSMLFTELGATWAPSLPDDQPEAGYESYSFEQLGPFLADAQVVVHPLNADGSTNAAVQAVLDSPFFTPPAKAAGHVFGNPVMVTDYVTATAYIHDIESTILQHL